jgi:hypothetical protein
MYSFDPSPLCLFSPFVAFYKYPAMVFLLISLLPVFGPAKKMYL